MPATYLTLHVDDRTTKTGRKEVLDIPQLVNPALDGYALHIKTLELQVTVKFDSTAAADGVTVPGYRFLEAIKNVNFGWGAGGGHVAIQNLSGGDLAHDYFRLAGVHFEEHADDVTADGTDQEVTVFIPIACGDPGSQSVYRHDGIVPIAALTEQGFSYSAASANEIHGSITLKEIDVVIRAHVVALDRVQAPAPWSINELTRKDLDFSFAIQSPVRYCDIRNPVKSDGTMEFDHSSYGDITRMLDSLTLEPTSPATIASDFDADRHPFLRVRQNEAPVSFIPILSSPVGAQLTELPFTERLRLKLASVPDHDATRLVFRLNGRWDNTQRARVMEQIGAGKDSIITGRGGRKPAPQVLADLIPNDFAWDGASAPMRVRARFTRKRRMAGV